MACIANNVLEAHFWAFSLDSSVSDLSTIKTFWGRINSKSAEIDRCKDIEELKETSWAVSSATLLHSVVDGMKARMQRLIVT